MMLSGNLTDWSVGDLLQMLHITKKTVSLHVTGVDRHGVVHFEEGAIVNADVSLGGGAARDPRDEVIEAIYVLELLDEGTFEIRGEVPSRMIEPISVADALELAGTHLTAERQLDQTGLLAARALRLAHTIEEPIVLSEQVWNAISGSIPAFTFPELEERMGRAAAIATVEQFRDLGILEAVLEDPDPSEKVGSVGMIEPIVPEDVPEPVETQDEAVADAIPDPGWGAHTVDEVTEEPAATHHDGPIVPINAEEIRPIVTEAPADDIVVSDEGPEQTSTAGISSLSAAIRAAAVAGGADEQAGDDESTFLTEAAGPEEAPTQDLPQAGEDSLRRTVRSLVSEPKPSPLTNGMLGDLGARIRQAASVDRDD